MTDSTARQSVDYIKWLGLGFIAGLIVSVVALDFYGYLAHPTAEDSLVVDEFRLLSLSTKHDVKVSPKSSGKLALCVNGYLLLRPANDKQVAGVLVDGKNRAVACEANLATATAPKTPETTEPVVPSK